MICLQKKRKLFWGSLVGTVAVRRLAGVPREPFSERFCHGDEWYHVRERNRPMKVNAQVQSVGFNTSVHTVDSTGRLCWSRNSIRSSVHNLIFSFSGGRPQHLPQHFSLLKLEWHSMNALLEGAERTCLSCISRHYPCTCTIPDDCLESANHFGIIICKRFVWMFV